MLALKNYASYKIKHPSSWSAPAIMSVFILICMIVIFSFESLGMAKKEKNLEFRKTSLETIAEATLKSRDTKTKDALPDKLLLEKKLESQVFLDKIQKKDAMAHILLIGAWNQERYIGSNYFENTGNIGFADI